MKDVKDKSFIEAWTSDKLRAHWDRQIGEVEQALLELVEEGTVLCLWDGEEPHFILPSKIKKV